MNKTDFTIKKLETKFMIKASGKKKGNLLQL